MKLSEAQFCEHQAKLPRLPIPELQETTDKLLSWSAALLTPEEAAESAKVVKDFLIDKNQGEALQKLLVDYDKSTEYKTYFEEFWNEAYLAPNASVVLNLNPFFVLEDDPTPAGNSQVVRASSLVYSSLKFVSDLRRGLCSPDVVGRKKNIGLDMSQFRQLFSTARVPSEGNDRIETDESGTHVVVLRQGQFYYFDALWPTGEVAVTQMDIARNMQAIINDAAEGNQVASAMHAVGVLTAASRNQWAKARASMIQHDEKNAAVFKTIDSALFVVCLDDCSPESIDDRAANMLHGSYHLEPHTSAHEGLFQMGTLKTRGKDNWNLIIGENGAAGINFEHSAVDGHTVLRFASDVFADTIVSFARSVTKDTHGAEYLEPVVGKGTFFKTKGNKSAHDVQFGPRKMEFELNMEHVKAIHYSETSISDQVLQNEMRVLEFTSFGKRWIKSRNISPDAFVQVAMCVSHFILYGEFASQYESVMTKFFLHGRTEAARSCTGAAKKFAHAWIQMAMSLPGDVASAAGISNDSELDVAVGNNQAEHLRHLFKEAWTAQQVMVRECAKGHGVDRHLYGLKCQSLRHNGHAAQALFNCPAYKKLTNTILSTSNCGNPSLRLFGFGPVSPEGYGIGYIIKDDGIQFCVSSKHRQTARYIMTLQKFLKGMKELLHEEDAQKVTSMPLSPTHNNNNETKVHEPRVESDEGGYDFYGISGQQLKQYEQRQAQLQAVGVGISNILSAPVPERAVSPAPVTLRRKSEAGAAWSAANVHVEKSQDRKSSGMGDMQTLFGY